MVPDTYGFSFLVGAGRIQHAPFQVEGTTVTQLLRRDLSDVRDLSVEETDIEEVVRRIYLGE